MVFGDVEMRVFMLLRAQEPEEPMSSTGRADDKALLEALTSAIEPLAKLCP